MIVPSLSSGELPLGPTTASAGHLLVFEVLHGLFAALPGSSDRSQGWTDAQMWTTLVLMNVAGLDRVSDVARLEENEGLRVVAERMEPQLAGLSRHRIAERFRRGRARIFPSSRSIHGWLERFHLFGAKGFGVLDEVFHRLIRLGFASLGSAFATIDLDVTMIRSFKRECEPTYRAANGDVRGERVYQSLIAFARRSE